MNRKVLWPALFVFGCLMLVSPYWTSSSRADFWEWKGPQNKPALTPATVAHEHVKMFVLYHHDERILVGDTDDVVLRSNQKKVQAFLDLLYRNGAEITARSEVGTEHTIRIIIYYKLPSGVNGLERPDESE